MLPYQPQRNRYRIEAINPTSSCSCAECGTAASWLRGADSRRLSGLWRRQEEEKEQEEIAEFLLNIAFAFYLLHHASGQTLRLEIDYQRKKITVHSLVMHADELK